MTVSWFHAAPLPSGPSWTAGWSDASGPDFRAAVDDPAQAASVGELARTAGLEDAAWVRQVHGGNVLRAERPGLSGEADGLWTDVPGLGVVGRSADCPLILIGGARDDGSPVCGFAHASWRSTVRGIAGRLAEILSGAGAAPQRLAAWICPSAGPCCYEVGGEVRREALDRLGTGAARFFLPRGDRWILDLWTANRDQLERAGIPAAAIGTAGECTICCDGRYPSYRRDAAAAGRFAAIVGACGARARRQ